VPDYWGVPHTSPKEEQTLERFRLKSATTAVYHQDGDPKGLAVVIPSGSEVASFDPIDARARFDHSQFVTVKWAERTVQMFLLDLIERGERVNIAKQ
jgi:hypothetical protein